MPSGSFVVVTQCVQDCDIFIQVMHMHATLILFPLAKFDAIMGMDWLSTYHAVIDCHKKRMNFCITGRAISCIILAMEAYKMISLGYVGYLAHVGDINKPNIIQDSVPMV